MYSVSNIILQMLTVPLVGSGSGAALLGLTLVRGNDTEYATEKLVKSSNPSDLMTQEAFLKSIETPNLYTTSNPRKSAAPNKCLLTYYKFIFVRDPLVRLLTAYEAEKESVRTETKGNGSLAFSDFIADTLNQKIEWQDYQYSEPCRVPWDFIGESLWNNTGLILWLHPANERRRYKVTPSLIGWAQT